MKDGFKIVDVILNLVFLSVVLLLSTIGGIFISVHPELFETGALHTRDASLPAITSDDHDVWLAPDSSQIPDTPHGHLIRYGKDLIAHTAVYLGPKGKVKASTNGMNCQNCHLNAGTKPYGNNYSAVRSTYPKFRARSGTNETIEKRVNDCIERSLNGNKLEDSCREMRAIVSYIEWLGKDVPNGVSPRGVGLPDLPLLTRPADPEKGQLVFALRCIRCHGSNGEGRMHQDGLEWRYPPLYGNRSYNIGAGLYRLSRFAGYVKANMPTDNFTGQPVLTDEEAWDVAAFINSQQRPTKDLSMDWPDIAGKPFDHPFGPYADSFSEQHHKYGPFDVIKMNQVRK
jgi:thiosulfate dehydrogenase